MIDNTSGTKKDVCDGAFQPFIIIMGLVRLLYSNETIYKSTTEG